MQCTECRRVIHAFVDGELDQQTQDQLRAHLVICRACQSNRERIDALRAAIKAGAPRYKAPDWLERRVRQAIRTASSQRDRRRNAIWSWANLAASFACAAALAYGVVLHQSVPSDTQRLSEEIAANHTRSLLVDHLADVASSDQHTVKPWFAGKLDYSPPVVDLTRQGFALTGGRLDYVANQRVAVLAYRRREHVINLYVWPEKSAVDLPSELSSTLGYQQLRWTSAGMRYWAVSELGTQELDEFRQRLVAAIKEEDEQ